MGAYQQRVSNDDIWRIIAFLRTSGRADESLHADAKQGEILFWGKGGCGDCYMVGDQGQPDRTGPFAHRTGANIPYLRQSLVAPGADIMSNYAGVTVVTKDGKTIRGLESLLLDDYSVMLMEFSGKVHSFDRSDLRSVERDKKSLMPEYGNVFIAAELNNVLAYLLTLKGTGATR